MSQDSKSKEKQLTAIMFIAVFLTVFVVMATPKGISKDAYNNFLGVAIYCLAVAIIFLSLIIRIAPLAAIKNLTYIIGLGIVLGIIVASRSISIVSILAPVVGFVGAVIVYYKILSKLSERIAE